MRRLFSPAFALVALLAAGLTGCHIEEGSGRLEEQFRHVGTFDRIDVAGEFDSVHVQACVDCEAVVRVRGDDNLVEDVITGTSGSTLSVETHGWLWPKLPLEVLVVAPATVRVEVSGSAPVAVDGVDGSRFDAVVSGSGELRIAGGTRHFEADVSGSGAVRAFDLVARRADVSVSGSGRVEVCAIERLDASVSGSGAVRYDCVPQSLGRHVSGSGTIRGR